MSDVQIDKFHLSQIKDIIKQESNVYKQVVQQTQLFNKMDNAKDAQDVQDQI